jgi:hypothetical protein
VVSSVSEENAASSVSQLDAACVILCYLLFTVFIEEVEAGAEVRISMKHVFTDMMYDLVLANV